MPQADIPCDHRGMFSLSKAFELFKEVADVGRLDHPDCKVAVAVGLQAALHLDIWGGREFFFSGFYLFRPKQVVHAVCINLNEWGHILLSWPGLQKLWLAANEGFFHFFLHFLSSFLV